MEKGWVRNGNNKKRQRGKCARAVEQETHFNIFISLNGNLSSHVAT